MKVANHHPVAELQQRVAQEPYGALRTRLQAVVLAQQGRTARQIGAALGVGRRTVQEWIGWYNTAGLERLAGKQAPGSPPALEAAAWERFRARLDAGPTPQDHVCAFRGLDVQRILQEEFGVRRSLPTALRLLAAAGYRKLVPRPEHPKGDPQAREAFKQKFPALLQEIQRQHPDQRLWTFWEDEARLGQQGTLTRVWARKGSRPRALKQIGYEFLYVLAAVCPANGQSWALTAPYLNTALVNLFLQQLAASLPPDVHAVLVWDGAGYHKSGRLVIPSNITVIPLPAYSPELNPIENLWHFLRQHYWSNRCYADYDALDQAAFQAWQYLTPSLFQSVCAVTYA
jgi:transposase